MNLLTDPLIHASTPDGVEACTLPGVLHQLTLRRISSFGALQGWQEHSWFAFLVQLAALALQRAGQAEPPSSEEGWRALLLALTAGDAGPWALIVDDLGAPAFLQPPLASAGLLKRTEATPDAIDLPVTSKDHDLKAARLCAPGPEHWVYALVSLQTTQGFSGRGNYGIQRMNGGFGNRPYAACVQDLSWGGRFSSDVSLLLAHHAEVAVDHGLDPAGHALLWLLPWDGTSSLPMQGCDPWCIEICRLVRLVGEGADVVARLGPTKAARLSVASEAGDVGDPWTPIKLEQKKDREERRALTLGGSGWRYELLVELLIRPTYRPSLAMGLDADDALHAFIGRALVRGQGTTEGFHERILPIPPRAQAALRKRSAWLATLSSGRVERVKEAQNVLASAVRKLLAAGGEGASSERRHVPWLEAFRQAIDDRFFPSLWASLEGDAEQAALDWDRILYEQATVQLEDAIRTVPIAQARRLRAVAAAESMLHGGFRKRFAALFPDRSTEAARA